MKDIQRDKQQDDVVAGLLNLSTNRLADQDGHNVESDPETASGQKCELGSDHRGIFKSSTALI